MSCVYHNSRTNNAIDFLMEVHFKGFRLALNSEIQLGAISIRKSNNAKIS